jgi:SPP1 family predicted phage head-tail adaptor
MPRQLHRAIDHQRHAVTFQVMASVPDGDGGYTEEWTPLDPPNGWAAIEPATQRSLERVTASFTVQAIATHVVTLDYHPTLNIEARVFYHGRQFQIHAIQNVDERNRQLVLVCSEVLHAGGS